MCSHPWTTLVRLPLESENSLRLTTNALDLASKESSDPASSDLPWRRDERPSRGRCALMQELGFNLHRSPSAKHLDQHAHPAGGG